MGMRPGLTAVPLTVGTRRRAHDDHTRPSPSCPVLLIVHVLAVVLLTDEGPLLETHMATGDTDHPLQNHLAVSR